MESILARALEYTLGYWLKSFTRDQFKLQGRTVQLSNLGHFEASFTYNSALICFTLCLYAYILIRYFIVLVGRY